MGPAAALTTFAAAPTTSLMTPASCNKSGVATAVSWKKKQARLLPFNRNCALYVPPCQAIEGGQPLQSVSVMQECTAKGGGVMPDAP